MTIAEEELMAYVDGELDAAARARVEAAAGADPSLAAKLAAQQALKARLQAHFDPVLDEPLPASLRAAARATPRASMRPRRQWRWQEWSAMAATLVLGVLLGPYVMRASQPLPFISANGRVVAIGDLETALMHQPSGTQPANGHTAIGLSFRSSNGSYCRTFAMNPGPAGLACRQWGEWVVEVLARNPRPRQGTAADAYVQAGTTFPDAVRRAVEARMEGEPLSAEEEAAATSHAWRPVRP